MSDDCTNTSTVSTDNNYTYTVSTCDWTCSGTSNYSITIPVPPPRRILVRMPKEWSKERHAGWVDLINQKTRTGWIIEMSFSGPVEIHDPNIERRTFDEMLALILWRASESDKNTINQFMASP